MDTKVSLAIQTGSSNHTGSSRSAVGKYSLSLKSTSGISGDVSWNIKCCRPLMEWQASCMSGHEGEDSALCFLVFSHVKRGLCGKSSEDVHRPHNLSW